MREIFANITYTHAHFQAYFRIGFTGYRLIPEKDLSNETEIIFEIFQASEMALNASDEKCLVGNILTVESKHCLLLQFIWDLLSIFTDDEGFFLKRIYIDEFYVKNL